MRVRFTSVVPFDLTYYSTLGFTTLIYVKLTLSAHCLSGLIEGQNLGLIYFHLNIVEQPIYVCASILDSQFD
jgi:hypothetical protein